MLIIPLHFVIAVIRISLFAQNLFVALSAANVWVLLSISTTVLGNAVWYGCIAAVMVSGLLAQLASVCYKIAIEKDWVVVIAGNDKSQLSSEYLSDLSYQCLFKLSQLSVSVQTISGIV